MSPQSAPIKEAAKAPREQHSSGKRFQSMASLTWRRSLSAALVALLVLSLVEASLRIFVKPDPYAQVNHSWAWWVTNSLRQSGRPDIAIFGSSLMVATVEDTDATYLHKVVDQVTHRRSEFFEHLIQKRTGKPIRTQSFAIGGQMASDTYALLTVLLSGANKPSHIVWGIAPRDFVDATFMHPDNSETVSYMRKVAGGRDILGVRTSFASRIEDALDACLYLYRHRDMALIAQQQFLISIFKFLGWQEPGGQNQPLFLKNWATEHLAENEPENKWLVAPYEKGAPYTDNSVEYRARYNPFKPSTYQTQLDYYEKVLIWCRTQHVTTMIVNMPLTKTNEDLMPGGMYARYLNDVSALARKYDTVFLDLNKQELFPKKGFRDTAHMNALGGTRFWDLVAEHWPQS
jgi:hypothetical protein